jgi:CMP-N-acetylneuraminic acid synthetase
MLAIIPARGGSKRLPRKNILPFGGRPLLAWSVALALRIPAITRCVVSTEDDEIAGVAHAAGAEVITRPAEFASDEASSLDVLVHALDAAERSGEKFSAVVLLQPTNPLRPVEMVQRAIDRFDAEDCESLISVSRRRLKLGHIDDGCFRPSYVFGTQSRLMDDIFYENGLLYLIKRDTLRRGSLTGERVLAFETERPFDDVDIDEPVDLLIGEAILGAVRGQLGYT